jgi:hypothetical protein
MKDGFRRTVKMSMRYLSGLILGFLILTAHSTKADTIVVVNVAATYLGTSADPDAQNTIPVSLSSLGLEPGDEISMQAFGDFCYYEPNCFKFIVPPSPILGLFSTSSTLLSSSLLNRVPGAIGGVGTPVSSWTTFYGNLPTDIPQDFLIPQIPGSTEITIPAGANFLFLSVFDTLYGDNVDRDQEVGVRISLDSQTTSVAEPSTLVLVGCGLGLTLIMGLLSRLK